MSDSEYHPYIENYAQIQQMQEDYKRTYILYSLAAARGDMDAALNRDRIARVMPPDRVAEAQLLVKQQLSGKPSLMAPRSSCPCPL